MAGLRNQVGPQRILAVLEPRSNTMKLGTMAARLPQALEQADRVFCFGAKEGKHALGWDPKTVFAGQQDRVGTHDNLEALTTAVLQQARPGDHILIMSNGGFGGFHDKLIAALKQKFT